MKKKIHIVSFDIPFPADYGGVQDIFSRVKWFAQAGWEVHLHCFQYHRQPAEELEKLATVSYYPRPRGFLYLFSSWPFIVKTRIHNRLIDQLKTTEDPVILEGLHCSWYCQLQPGKFWVRTHNVEHEYYQQLALQACGWKRKYYQWEAKKLKKFESILKQSKGILAITPTDQLHFSQFNNHTFWIPPLYDIQRTFNETEPFILYHGNLSVDENATAANWIIDSIAPLVPEIPIVFAGKRPSEALQAKAEKAGIKVIADPSQEKMDALIKRANIHLLYTEQSTGIKIKLLHALSGSGHVICNSKMIAGTGLDEFVHIADNNTMVEANIHTLIDLPLSQEAWSKRQEKIKVTYGPKMLADFSQLLA
ncbi:MAG: hypothetical protein N4A41_14895 [Crocinitomicaceae bacterium]|nr:hypothetical protein [Crocinitomicaceae bacterium]